MSTNGLTGGGSGGTSTREAAERKQSQDSPDTLVRNTTQTPAAGAVAGGSISRVRDRQAAQEAMKPVIKKLTPAELAYRQNADGWLAMEQRFKDRAAAKERRAEQRVIDRANADAAAAERKKRLAAFDLKERLLASTYVSEGATSDEIRTVNTYLAANSPASFGNPDVHQVALWRLRADGTL